MIDGDGFEPTFFPAFAQVQAQIKTLKAELERVSGQRTRFQAWYARGQAIDVEFRELSESDGQGAAGVPGRRSPAPVPSASRVVWERLFGGSAEKRSA